MATRPTLSRHDRRRSVAVLKYLDLNGHASDLAVRLPAARGLYFHVTRRDGGGGLTLPLSLVAQLAPEEPSPDTCAATGRALRALLREI